MVSVFKFVFKYFFDTPPLFSVCLAVLKASPKKSDVITTYL